MENHLRLYAPPEVDLVGIGIIPEIQHYRRGLSNIDPILLCHTLLICYVVTKQTRIMENC